MFEGCGLSQIDISNWDTSKVTNMNGMFRNCANLQYVDMNNCSLENVTDMGSMFQYCGALTNISMRNNTSKVKSMASMFSSCSKLRSNMFEYFNTENLVSTKYMLHGTSFGSIDLSRWKAPKLENVERMFQNCSASTINISSWESSSLEGLSYMFEYCSSLYRVNLTFTKNNMSLYCLFYGCEKLTYIDLSNTHFDNILGISVHAMFNDCPSLTWENITLNNCDEFTIQKIKTEFDNRVY
jgi:surface protein